MVQSNIMKRLDELELLTNPNVEDQKVQLSDTVRGKEVSSVIKDISDASTMSEEMNIEGSLKKTAVYSDYEKEELNKWLVTNLAAEKIKAVSRFKKKNGLGEYNREASSKNLHEFDLGDLFFNFLSKFGTGLRGLQKNLADVPSKFVEGTTEGMDNLEALFKHFEQDFILFNDKISNLRYEVRMEFLSDYMDIISGSLKKAIYNSPLYNSDGSEKKVSKRYSGVFANSNMLLKNKRIENKDGKPLPIDLFYDLNKITNSLKLQFEKLDSNKNWGALDGSKIKLASISYIIDKCAYSYSDLVKIDGGLKFPKKIIIQLDLRDSTSYLDILEEHLEGSSFQRLSDWAKKYIHDTLVYHLIVKPNIQEKGKAEVNSLFSFSEDIIGADLLARKESYKAKFKDVEDLLRDSYKILINCRVSLFDFVQKVFAPRRTLESLYNTYQGEEGIRDDHKSIMQDLDSLYNNFIRSIYSSDGLKDLTTPMPTLLSSASILLKSYLNLYNRHLISTFKEGLIKGNLSPDLVDSVEKAQLSLSDFYTLFKRNSEKFEGEFNALTSNFKLNTILTEFKAGGEKGLNPFNSFIKDDPYYAIDSPENLFSFLQKRYQWDEFTKRSLKSVLIKLREDLRKPAKDPEGKILRETETTDFGDAEADAIIGSLLGVRTFTHRSDTHLEDVGELSVEDLMGKSEVLKYKIFNQAKEEFKFIPKEIRTDFSELGSISQIVESIFEDYNADEFYLREKVNAKWTKSRGLSSAFFHNLVDEEGNLESEKLNLHAGPFFAHGFSYENLKATNKVLKAQKFYREEKDSEGATGRVTSLDRVGLGLNKPLEKEYSFEDKIGSTDDRLIVMQKALKDTSEVIFEMEKNLESNILDQITIKSKKELNSFLKPKLIKEQKAFLSQLKALNNEMLKVDSKEELKLLESLRDTVKGLYNQVTEELKESSNSSLVEKRSFLLKLFRVYIQGILSPLEFLNEDILKSSTLIEVAREELDAFKNMSPENRINYKIKSPIIEVDRSNSKSPILTFKEGFIEESLGQSEKQVEGLLLGMSKNKMSVEEAKNAINLVRNSMNSWIAQNRKRYILDHYPKGKNKNPKLIHELMDMTELRIIRGEELLSSKNIDKALLDNLEFDIEKLKDYYMDEGKEVSKEELDEFYSNVVHDLRLPSVAGESSSFPNKIITRLSLLRGVLRSQLSKTRAMLEDSLNNLENAIEGNIVVVPQSQSRYPKLKTIEKTFLSEISSDENLVNMSSSQLLRTDPTMLDSLILDREQSESKIYTKEEEGSLFTSDSAQFIRSLTSSLITQFKANPEADLKDTVMKTLTSILGDETSLSDPLVKLIVSSLNKNLFEKDEEEIHKILQSLLGESLKESKRSSVESVLLGLTDEDKNNLLVEIKSLKDNLEIKKASVKYFEEKVKTSFGINNLKGNYTINEFYIYVDNINSLFNLLELEKGETKGLLPMEENLPEGGKGTTELFKNLNGSFSKFQNDPKVLKYKVLENRIRANMERVLTVNIPKKEIEVALRKKEFNKVSRRVQMQKQRITNRLSEVYSHLDSKTVTGDVRFALSKEKSKLEKEITSLKINLNTILKDRGNLNSKLSYTQKLIDSATESRKQELKSKYLEMSQERDSLKGRLLRSRLSLLDNEASLTILEDKLIYKHKELTEKEQNKRLLLIDNDKSRLSDSYKELDSLEIPMAKVEESLNKDRDIVIELIRALKKNSILSREFLKNRNINTDFLDGLLEGKVASFMVKKDKMLKGKKAKVRYIDPKVLKEEVTSLNKLRNTLEGLERDYLRTLQEYRRFGSLADDITNALLDSDPRMNQEVE